MSSGTVERRARFPLAPSWEMWLRSADRICGRDGPGQRRETCVQPDVTASDSVVDDEVSYGLRKRSPGQREETWCAHHSNTDGN